jgi:feruloyl esterase
MFRLRASLTFFALLIPLLAAVHASRQGAAPPAADACTSLLLLRPADLPNRTTAVVSAVLRPPAAPEPGGPGRPPTPALPEHCEVLGRMDDRTTAGGQRYAINFRLRMPTDWNGRFFFEGGGGTNGTIGTALGNLQGRQPTVALALGYAVVAQDSGHDNATNEDPDGGGAQAFGFDPRARIDFGYNSYDQVTRAAKAIVERRYGRRPERSYYVGCSEGGREGLVMTQRFAEHFDGVLACAPGLRLPQAALSALADAQELAAAARRLSAMDPYGMPLLNKAFSDEDLLLVTGAVLAACDGLDGVADGMVQRFAACTTPVVAPRLTALACTAAKTADCLLPAQISALRDVFAGTTTSTGERVYPARVWDAGIGGKVGASFNQGWRAWKLGAHSAFTNTALDVTLSSTALAAIFLTPPVRIATTDGDQVAYAFTVDIDDAARALAARSGPYTESALEFMKADSTDLSAFRKRNGRLLIVHGASDPVFSITDTIDWWTTLDTVERGRAAEFVRLFGVPGMNHCGGGPSTDQFNAFGALVDWVEKGVAPDRIVATAGASTPWPGRTRPLCPYPQAASYAGGNIDDAASFTCSS